MTEAQVDGPDRSSSRGGRGSWLRLALFNVILVGVPLGIYFVFYVDARIEQTTVRNFRALDAAAERLVTIIENVPRVAENVPVPLGSDLNEPRNIGRLRRSLPDRCNVVGDTVGGNDTLGNLDAINDIYNAYTADFRAAAGSSAFRIVPLLTGRDASVAADPDSCEAQRLAALDARIRILAQQPNDCSESGPSRRLQRTAAGVQLEVDDCRPFSVRSPKLSGALEGDGVRRVLDRFGVRVVVALDSLVGNVAANVAPLFDQYLITDADGRTLYRADADDAGFRYEGVTGAPKGRRVHRDFVSQVDVATLVRATERPAESTLTNSFEALSPGGADAELYDPGQEWSRYGVHSRLERFRVGDIPFNAFVHPFVVNELELQSSRESGASGDGAGQAGSVGLHGGATVLYMIGIVNRESLSSDSLRLRISLVSDALLAIGVLFSSMAMIWLWTAGSRIMLGFRHLLLILFTGMASVFLFTLLVLHVGSRLVDARALDSALATVSARMREDFAVELRERVGFLAAATDQMIQYGQTLARQPETDVRLAGVPLPREVAGAVKRRFYCRPDAAGPSWQAAFGENRFPPFDLAFLLDTRGLQWQCLSFRRFDTPPLMLSFRSYFQRPRDEQLWLTDPDMPGVFLERVTSVLDGTTETVLSARPADLCRYAEAACAGSGRTRDLAAAVTIGRFLSLEDTVSVPHVRFAVVDDRTGATLFHSVKSRALAANFVKQTEGDGALLAHMDAGTAGFVDLDYHGSSIRAYSAPLAEGIPWTLVIYRGYELEDTLGAMAMSATGLTVVGTWLLWSLVVALVWLGRGLRQGSWRMRPLPELRYMRTMAVLLMLCSILIIVSGASLAGGIIATLASLAGFGGIAAAGGKRRRPVTGTARAAEQRARLSIVSALLIGLLAVVPAVGWFTYYRAQVSAGFGDYLREAADQAIVEKCGRYRGYAGRYRDGPAGAGDAAAERWQGVFAHGWALAFADAADPPQQGDCAPFAGAGAKRLTLNHRLDARPREGVVETALLNGTSSFSGLADDLAVHAAEVRASARLASPAEVLNGLLDDGGWGFWRNITAELLAFLLLAAILGFLLVRLVIMSLVDRLLGAHPRIAILPEAHVSQPPAGWRRPVGGPLRACVVHRSEHLCRLLVARLVESRFAVARSLRWNGAGIEWASIRFDDAGDAGDAEGGNDPDVPVEPADDPGQSGRFEPLYVIDGFERLLMDAASRNALLAELERLVDQGASVLILSRILPGYWLAKLTEEAVGDLPDVPEGVAQSTRWSHVIGPMDVRRIRDRRELLERRFERELGRLAAGLQVPESIRAQLEEEGVANPELLNLAAAVARNTATDGTLEAEIPTDVALRHFAVGAAGHFHELWATSSYEERLQLYSLANGGFANPTQTPVLSSLANRGLISIDGIVRLRSRAFGEFIRNDLSHDVLRAWRDIGHGNLWRSIWPPLVVIVVLALTFFVSSTPEALGPLAVVLAAGLGAVPVIGSVIRSFRDLRHTAGE